LNENILKQQVLNEEGLERARLEGAPQDAVKGLRL